MVSDEIHIIPVALFFHLLIRDEAKSRAVDTVPQSAPVDGAVVEDMAKVAVSRPASDFRPFHVMALIFQFLYRKGFDRPREAGPAASGVKLIRGGEERFPRNDVHVQSALEMIEILIPIGVFCRLILCNLKLKRRQPAFQFFRRGDRIAALFSLALDGIVIPSKPFLLVKCIRFSDVNMAVAARILL